MTATAANNEQVSPPAARPPVRQFRQIVMWPLRLLPLQENAQIQNHWEYLEQPGPDNPWSEVADEFTGDPQDFQERHYNEFVTFLPPVQRFLYGEGIGLRTKAAYGESPMRVFRRRDIARVRITHDGAPELIVLEVAHVDLYFFYDIDIVLLAFEVHARDLAFELVQEILFRFGRAYPTFWHESGEAGHCFRRVEWLAADGSVLAASDYERREKYLSFVCRHRAPCIAAHWSCLLRPLILHHADEQGALRFRQLEYHRMPVAAYLSLDDPDALTRADYARLALVAPPGDSNTMPYAAGYLDDFERRFCYDRYREARRQAGWSNTRFLTCGHAFVMVGSEASAFYIDAERGLLAQFRHQYFLLSLLAHFHKAALRMLADRLVFAVSKLDIEDPASVRRFRREIRQAQEIYLRFTHRYWFPEVSDQVQAKDLFAMMRAHLGLDELHKDVREELQDMGAYLDSDAFRRQSNTMLRLTVVTILGLIGTVTTGFLGMNVLAAADEPLWWRGAFFALVFALATALTVYTVMKSRRLSEFLDALSDERVPLRRKWDALAAVWRR